MAVILARLRIRVTPIGVEPAAVREDWPAHALQEHRRCEDLPNHGPTSLLTNPFAHDVAWRLTSNRDGDFQTTAYAVLGLRADPWNFTLPWQQAIIEGVDFFEANATPAPTCGWSYPPEYGEMNSEIVSALAVVNTLPFVDGFETSDTSAWSSEVPGSPLVPPAASANAARPAVRPMR